MRFASFSLLLLLNGYQSSSFVSTRSYHLRYYSVERSVTIYAPDGGVFEDDESNVFSTPTTSHSLMDTISQDAAAELARLAVAFCPPNHSLKLEEIENVHVLDVDRHHITIEAVLCETDGCVTLAIPVSFPTPCSDEDITQCVLENVSRLDSTAHSTLQEHQNRVDNFEDLEHEKRTLVQLKDSTTIEWPLWWENPGDLLSECTSIQSLLNEEDFLPDVRQLAAHHLDLEGQVQLAAVAMVGSTGMILRAQIKEGYRENTVTIPITFGQTCRTVESLRAVVLGLVAAATADIPDQALQTPAQPEWPLSEPIISADDIL